MAPKVEKPPDDQFSPEETARRRDDAIRRALDTPPSRTANMSARVSVPRCVPRVESRSPVDKV